MASSRWYDSRPTERRVWPFHLGFAVLFLAGWYMTVEMLSVRVLVTPHEVIARLYQAAVSGEAWTYLVPTAKVLLTGAGISVAFGLPIGIAVGRFGWLDRLTDASIYALYLMPKVALVPFLVVALGYGTGTKVLIVVLSAIFPIIINIAGGVRTVDADLLEMARSFCSEELQTWRDVVVPAARPLMLTGLRLGLTHALTGAVVADFYAGASGFGYLIILNSNRFDVAGALYPVIVLGLLGYAIVAGLKWIERRTTPWLRAA